MRNKLHSTRGLWAALGALLVCAVTIAPAWAQDYGTGVVVDVPSVDPAVMVMDGVMSEPKWDVAAMFDPLAFYNFYTGYVTEPDLEIDARAMYATDTLYVFVTVYDNGIYVGPVDFEWDSDQILIGIDGTHAGDDQVDENYSGWPLNAPDLGPTTYKVSPAGITHNWGYDGIDPVAEGWVRGTVFQDETTLEWGVEMAIYVGQIEPGAQIGFNIGGANASQASLDFGNSEAAYGYYSWQALSNGTAGGDVMNNAASFATMNLLGGGGGGDYGVGVTVEVPSVDPAVMVMDGVMDEPKWDVAAMFDPVAFYNFYTDYASEPDLEIDARAMYATDTLYVFVTVYDNGIYVGPVDFEWDSDQILIGVDGTHAGDDQVDDNYSGWPLNAPDLGPTTYKISPAGITHNWGYDGIDPVAEGWVRGTVFQDETTLEWGVEMAIYVGQIEPGAEIGFNIGGANASQASLDFGNSEAAYGYYSWQALSNGTAGGDVMNNAASFGTLKMLGGGGGSGYGTGVTVNVPQTDPATMVMDGEQTEAIWATAPVFDPLAFYNFYTDYATEPDLEIDARTAYATDTLYVFVTVYDNGIYVGPVDFEWDSDQILIGVDGTHAGDDQVDDNYAGWPLNAPDLGPTTYKISPAGITHNWGYDGIDPVAEGWVRGTVFQDETTLEWGVEMAIYVGQIEPGVDIGFNIGGANASQASLDFGNSEAAYGYYSWQALSNGTAGGDVMNNAASFGTLHMEGSIAVEELELDGTLPADHALHQNYPNPFNPQTTIAYDVREIGHVRLDVFNLLGQRVASLVDGPKPSGRYQVTWDASGLTSGVYLVRLRVDDTVVGTKQLTLMK